MVHNFENVDIGVNLKKIQILHLQSVKRTIEDMVTCYDVRSNDHVDFLIDILQMKIDNLEKGEE